MSINTRLDAVEKVVLPRDGSKGMRLFVTIEDSQIYFENTQGPGLFSYTQALQGMDAQLPEGVHRLTRADIDAIGAEGWQCLIVCYTNKAGRS
jgi:hypothetical protein